MVRPVWVTCYTDASFSRAGGAWAVWLRSDLGRIVRSGACPTWVRDSFSAELSAIYAGIYLALRTWGNEVRGVRVYSDCQGALAAVSTAPRTQNESILRLHRRVRELAAHGVELEPRWVKGHRPRSSGTTAWLNAECDRLAKRQRRKIEPR